MMATVTAASRKREPEFRKRVELTGKCRCTPPPGQADKDNVCIDFVVPEDTVTLPGGLSVETQAIIGGAVGGGLCVLASLVIGLAMLRRRRQQKKAELPTFTSPMTDARSVHMAEFTSARQEPPSIQENSSVRSEGQGNYMASGLGVASLPSSYSSKELGRDEGGGVVQVGRGYQAVPSSVSDSNGYNAVPPVAPHDSRGPVVVGAGYAQIPDSVSSASSIPPPPGGGGSLKLPPAPMQAGGSLKLPPLPAPSFSNLPPPPQMGTLDDLPEVHL
jgi:hypothetical protein